MKPWESPLVRIGEELMVAGLVAFYVVAIATTRLSVLELCVSVGAFAGAVTTLFGRTVTWSYHWARKIGGGLAGR